MPILDIRRHAQRHSIDDQQSALSTAGREMCEKLAKETAQRIAGRLDAVEPALLPDLGSYASSLFGEMKTLADWARLLRDHPDGRKFADEQIPAWARIAARVGEKERVLAVSHGGIIDLPAVLLMERLRVKIEGASFG